MERSSSALNGLRGKKENHKSVQNIQLTMAVVGIGVSLAFLFMMMAERPQAGIWIAAAGAFMLALRVGFRFYHRRLRKKVEVQFHTLHHHRVGKHLPWFKAELLGHDRVVEQLVLAVDRDLKLASPGKVMGTHLLVGPHGSGKTYFSSLLAKALFGTKNRILFDFGALDTEAFQERFLDMLDALESNPHQLIVLENIDRIDPAMLDPFLEILRTSEWEMDDDEPIDFSGCMFLMTAALDLEEGKHHRDLIDYRVLSHCSEILTWGALSNRVLAEIACRELHAHWLQHGVKLEFVMPEAIFEILKEMRPQAHLGAHLLPPLVRRKSTRALEQASLARVGAAVLANGANGLFELRRMA